MSAEPTAARTRDVDLPDEVRCCAIVPTYENPSTIGSVVDSIRAHLPDVIVVDDGSSDPGRRACEAIAETGRARLVRRPHNGGKGAAVWTGLRAARAAGFSHAFQIDADGQHDVSAIPTFLTAARAHPTRAIFPTPSYDASAPPARRIGREITRFWVDLEIGRGRIDDALVGFRIYPVEASLALPIRSFGMDFDVEIAVLLSWSGVAIENRPVAVRYLSEDEGGRSHFRVVRDNAKLAWLHTRLCTRAATRFCLGRSARRISTRDATGRAGCLRESP